MNCSLSTSFKTFVLAAFVTFFPLNVYANGGGVSAAEQQTPQGKIIKGTVVDSNGDPIMGATVRVKGNSGNGAITNVNGEFTLKNVTDSQSIIVSCIGFKERVLPIKKQTILSITLQEDSKMIDEVVVIGSGTQKKVSVTGAITSVKGSMLKIPSSSLTTAFAGQLAGVISMTRTGAPGSTSEFYIRGIGTFGGRATPLIMLDDVEISAGDLNNIPAETIESFSILKDASATAIYGSRGANGVMLIKTKNGGINEKTKVNVTLENSFNVPTGFPKFVDGATWMELYNEALLTRNPNATPRYTDDRIRFTREGVDPYMYPDVNWNEVIFRKMAMSQRANINVQGGGNKATYYMSIQLNHDSGILNSQKVYSWDNNINNIGYNFQNNISYKLTPSTTIDLRMNAQIRNYQGGNYNPAELFGKILSSNPINFPVTFPAREDSKHILFGSSVVSGNNFKENIYASMLNSFRETQSNTINTSFKLSQKFDFLTKGLSGTLLVNFKNWSQNYYTRSIDPYLYRIADGSYNAETHQFELERLGTSGTDYISQSGITKHGDQTFFLQSTLDYSRKFGFHSLSGMLLYMQREFKNDVLPHRNQGVSGRFMYNYYTRYFAELNFGYTGTERLAKNNRFEFFPALSLGWAVSEEPFFQPYKNVVDFLKIRGSYGLIGSDETGLAAGAEHFLYIDKVILQKDGYQYTTGENLGFTKKGPEMQNYAVANARWEKVKKLNLGLDMSLFNALSITAEYFYDKRYDILLHREAWPQSLGYHIAKPWSNKGKVDNWGFELSANYNKAINQDFSVEVRGNFTYNQNKYVDVDDPVYKYPWQSRTGFPLSYTMGYVAEGLFESEEQIKNSPEQSLGSKVLPGDIKYKDINGDGVIDDTDKIMISPYGGIPRIQYGFGASVRYKKFDCGVFFNGSAQRTIMTGLMSPFGQNDNNVFQFIADHRWNEKSPDPNALYPRLGLLDSDRANNAKPSTYWMRDGRFLRFKTLEMGYTFKHGRVYFSGNNLAVFSPFKQWDPELAWNAYPLQRTFNVGCQLNF